MSQIGGRKKRNAKPKYGSKNLPPAERNKPSHPSEVKTIRMSDEDEDDAEDV